MSEKVNPFCKKFPSAFIEFTGLVTPCCWLITTKERHDAFKDFMGNDYENLFITKGKDTITKTYIKIEKSWDTAQPFKTCLEICGADVDQHPYNLLYRT